MSTDTHERLVEAIHFFLDGHTNIVSDFYEELTKIKEDIERGKGTVPPQAFTLASDGLEDEELVQMAKEKLERVLPASQGFVQSIIDYYAKNGYLSTKQRTSLEATLGQADFH